MKQSTFFFFFDDDDDNNNNEKIFMFDRKNAAAFCRGKFPIGVAKYLFWPNVTWEFRVTSTHHLWTIPVLLFACDGMHVLSCPLSMVIVTINVLLSRYMTPIAIIEEQHDTDTVFPKFESNSSHTQAVNTRNRQQKCETNKSDQKTSIELKYLNLNMSHELWKDIKLWIVASAVVDNPPPVVYLFRLLWRWSVLNVIVFCVLYAASEIFVIPKTGLHVAPVC